METFSVVQPPDWFHMFLWLYMETTTEHSNSKSCLSSKMRPMLHITASTATASSSCYSLSKMSSNLSQSIVHPSSTWALLTISFSLFVAFPLLTRTGVVFWENKQWFILQRGLTGTAHLSHSAQASLCMAEQGVWETLVQGLESTNSAHIH